MAIRFDASAGTGKTVGGSGLLAGKERTFTKRGRPLIEERALTNEARKPWEAAGMSRRTWYRRQERARKSD